MRRTNIARDVYGKPRSENDANLNGGRKPRARNLRVSKIEDHVFCDACLAPMTCCQCHDAKPRHRDSVMERDLYRHKATRTLFYRTKGRLA